MAYLSAANPCRQTSRSRVLAPSRSHPRREGGQSIVELALCLPLFMLLMLGTAEIANLAWAALQLNSAARAGAQYGAQSRTNATDTTDITTAAKNDAPTLAASMTVTPVQSCSCVDTGGNSTSLTCNAQALTNCPSPKVIHVSVQVTTSAKVKPLLHYPFLPSSYTMTGSSALGVEQ